MVKAALNIGIPGLKLPFEHHLSAWDAFSGAYLTAFPRVMEDTQFFVIPAIAELDGDGLAEIIAGSGGYLLHAFNHFSARNPWVGLNSRGIGWALLRPWVTLTAIASWK
jgi:hypothetical protein